VSTPDDIRRALDALEWALQHTRSTADIIREKDITIAVSLDQRADDLSHALHHMETYRSLCQDVRKYLSELP
jgi:hypothetical protein